MEEGGKITVIARLDKGYLVIEMIDTGPGVDVESTSDSHTGVGLRNTIDRLHEFYAADYTFRLERAGSQGTRVYMRLPLEKQLGALS